MRKRIRAIAEGKFDYKDIEVRVSKERIERMARKNEVLKGSVVLESSDERKLKGLIYTTDRRMVCEEVQFRGKKVQVSYEFDTTGMEEGDTNKGEIYIESNAGEIIIPYVVSIAYHAIDSSIGKVRDLFHFANLAQLNYQEAYKLFCSKKFRQIRMNEEHRQLYEALVQSNVCKESMEEFLVAIHKKQPVRFILNASEENYRCEGDSFKKEVLLSKNTWGHFSIGITTDADFITMDKSIVTSEDFVGNHYNWEFVVDRKKLHAGINVAKIIFSSGIQTESMSVEIGVPSVIDREFKQEKKLLNQLSELYIKVRNHAIKDSVWLKEATTIVESLNGLVPERDLYMLMQAQMYTMSGRQTEGKWILNKFENLSQMKEEQPVLYGYYQYIDALQKKDDEYNRIVCRELQNLTEEYPQEFSLLRIRLFLDEELERNKSYKYRLLKNHFEYGCRSPFLYLEACLLWKKDMSLLNRLEEFEQHVLIFAMKHGMLDKELLDKTAALAIHLKQWEPFVYKVLCYGCQKFYDSEHLKMADKTAYENCVEAICAMLIRSNKRNRQYFPWFEKGVSLDMKLTQLFEYYMYSMPMERTGMLPKTLLMYFNFDNSLDYKRKAYLYVNVWKYREELGDLFHSYEPRMKMFVIDQVLHRHINEHLAYLYRKMSDYILLDQEAASVFEELIFTCKFTCDVEGVRNVIVRHAQIDKEEIFPILDGTAYIKLYHPSAMVLLEDREGRRHLDTIAYEKEPLMADGEISKYCLKLAHTKTGLLLNRYYRKGAVLNEKISEICEKLLEKPEIKQEFKQELLKQLIEYYMETKAFDHVEQHLQELDYEQMSIQERAHYLELMIIRGLYRNAYELVLCYGPEKINPKRLVRMCSRLIVIDEAEEALLDLCYYVFSKGKYDEMILEYLTRYFYGPTWQMDKLWRAAKQFDVETYGIGERILVQMLFTGYLLPGSGEVFEDYYRPGYKADIVQAYLAFFAYYYVVHEQMIDERVIHWIEKEYISGESVNKDCKAALLKYYASMPTVPDMKVEFLKKLMKEFVDTGVLFPFFANMDSKVSAAFRMEEKTLIEHRASPDKKVSIFYGMQDFDEGSAVFVRDEMEHVYDSIFVKELTTFYGEVVQYYITESDKDGEDFQICTSGIIEKQISSSEETEGRYQMLNEMAASYSLQDEESLYELMKRYSRLENCAQDLFTLIE